MTDAEKLNQAITRARRLVAGNADAIEQAYASALARVTDDAVARFELHAGQTAAVAGWQKPDADEVAHLQTVIAGLAAAGEDLRAKVVTQLVGEVGAALHVSFDVRNPAIEGVIEQLGGQITNIAETQRQMIMSEIDSAWQEGLSVPDTAARVSQRMGFLNQARSVLISRTEMAAATNGGALAIAQVSGVAPYKQWLTAPGARYPRHEESDDLDGQTRLADDTFDVDGYPAMFPADPDLPPEESCNCRCTVIFGTLADLQAAANPTRGRMLTRRPTMPRTETLTTRTIRVTEDEPRRLPARFLRRPTGQMQLVIRRVTAAADGRRGWEGEIMFVDTPTGDGREYASSGYGHRDLPLPLMAMFQDSHGGWGDPLSELAGQIETLTLDGTAVLATGSFSDDDTGARAAAAVESGDMPGISVDPAVTAYEVIVPPAAGVEATDEDGNPVDEETLIDAFWGENDETVIIHESVEGGISYRFTEWEIMGATLVPFPAFADAQIRATETADADVVTASAAGLVDELPPREWFDMPEADVPMPLTVTDDGQVYGHLACWDTCHTGFQALRSDSCVRAPRSDSGYAYFHQSRLAVSGGGTLECGKLTVGDAGHAGPGDRFDTVAHYDQTGTTTAFVRARDGQHGVWVCGAVNPDAPAEKVRTMAQSALSGDWRRVPGHGMELVAALAVNVPGFPIPRAVVEGGETVALAAAGVLTQADGEQIRELVARSIAKHRVAALAAQARGGMEGLAAAARG